MFSCCNCVTNDPAELDIATPETGDQLLQNACRARMTSFRRRDHRNSGAASRRHRPRLQFESSSSLFMTTTHHHHHDPASSSFKTSSASNRISTLSDNGNRNPTLSMTVIDLHVPPIVNKTILPIAGSSNHHRPLSKDDFGRLPPPEEETSSLEGMDGDEDRDSLIALVSVPVNDSPLEQAAAPAILAERDVVMANGRGKKGKNGPRRRKKPDADGDAKQQDGGVGRGSSASTAAGSVLSAGEGSDGERVLGDDGKVVAAVKETGCDAVGFPVAKYVDVNGDLIKINDRSSNVKISSSVVRGVVSGSSKQENRQGGGIVLPVTEGIGTVEDALNGQKLSRSRGTSDAVVVGSPSPSKGRNASGYRQKDDVDESKSKARLSKPQMEMHDRSAHQHHQKQQQVEQDRQGGDDTIKKSEETRMCAKHLSRENFDTKTRVDVKPAVTASPSLTPPPADASRMGTGTTAGNTTTTPTMASVVFTGNRTPPTREVTLSSGERRQIPLTPIFTRGTPSRSYEIDPPVKAVEPSEHLKVEELEQTPFFIWLATEFEPLDPSATSRQWTSQDKIKERDRLSRVVRTFARTAVRNRVPCEYADQSTGAIQPASYCLDKEMKSFTIQTPHSAYSFLMDYLHEVYTWESMQRSPKLANFVKMQGFQILSDAEKSRLVMVEYIDERHYVQRVCILVNETEFSAEDFANCLRILRIFVVVPSPRKKYNKASGTGGTD